MANKWPTLEWYTRVAMGDTDDETERRRQLLEDRQARAQDAYDQALFKLSGGALGLSFIFMAQIAGDDPRRVWALWWAWGLWIVSLVCGPVVALPAPDCRVIRFQAAFAEQLFDIAEGERVPKVPAHRAQNQRGLRLSPLEDRRSDCLLHHLFRLPAATGHSCNTTRQAQPGPAAQTA